MTYSSISQGGLSLMSKSAFSSVPQPRAYPFVGNAPSIDIDDPAWAIAHRMLMPAFGAPAMRRYWSDMVDVTDQLVMKWERLGPQVDHDVADNMTRLTLDTIALSGFSYRFNSYYQREMHPFVDS